MDGRGLIEGKHFYSMGNRLGRHAVLVGLVRYGLHAGR